MYYSKEEMRKNASRRGGLISSTAVALVLAATQVGLTDETTDGYVPYPIGTNPDTDWIVDRADVSVFANVGSYEGRSDVLMLAVDPSTVQGGSFYNWQGYMQKTAVPAGNSFLSGDLWIADGWQSGTASDFVNTGMWGSAMPEDLVAQGNYVNPASVFPIVHFTNEDGVGRLKVWDTTVNPDGGWIDLPETAGLINYEDWNTIQLQLLPEQNKIEYLLNGEVFYTWDMPHPENPDLGVVDQFFAMYLKARNNGVTAFSSYWSRLMSGLLISGGEAVTDTPGDVLVDPGSEAVRTVVVGDGANIGGSVVSNGGSDGAMVTFTGGANVAGGIIGTNSVFRFGSSETNVTTIGGDVELDEGSVTGGGTVTAPIVVTGGVTVDGTSVFGGNWQIGGNLSVDGTISPGNSIGTVTVAGNHVFGPGSNYMVEINSQGDSDRLNVGGVATLDGTVEVVPLGGGADFVLGQPYTIVQAQGGFAGSAFDGTTWAYGSPFLSPELSYGSTSVFLTIERSGAAFASTASTANQAAAAGGLDSLSFGNSAYDEVALSAVDPASAFDQLSGEIHATARNSLTEDSRLVRTIVSDRIRGAFDGPAGAQPPDAPGVWMQAIGSTATLFSDGNAGEASRKTGGFVIGAENTRADSWSFGFAGGYDHTDIDVGSRLSSASVDSFHVAAYGGGKAGDFTLTFGGAHSWHTINTERSFVMSAGTQHLSADYAARTAQVFGEIGYDVSLGGIGLQPFAAAAYVNQHQDRFVEHGGDAALSGLSSDNGLGVSTVGLRADKTLTLGEGVAMRVSGMAGWAHAFGDISPTAALAFDGGTTFDVAGTPIARDSAVVDLGVTIPLSRKVGLGATYSGKFSSELSSHDLNAKLSIRF